MMDLQKNKRRATRRKRNMIAKTMRETKIFHEKAIQKKKDTEEKCPWCNSGGDKCFGVDECYYA